METHKSYREESRKNYGSTSDLGLTIEQIQVGAILRIADATEKMALRYTELIDQRDRFERDAKYWRDRAETADRRNSALRGVITKMRKKRA